MGQNYSRPLSGLIGPWPSTVLTSMERRIFMEAWYG